jgi:hypothetical protein
MMERRAKRANLAHRAIMTGLTPGTTEFRIP